MPQGSKILIVEDEMIISMEIKQKLREMGYLVTGQAITGESAIQKVVETHPDLVLMDIRLKGEMDGITAAKRIMELYDLPIIFLTAHSDKATLERAIAVSPSGYLLKPFKDRELMTNIEMSLHKHRIKQKVREDTYSEGQTELAKSITLIQEPTVVISQSGQIDAINNAAIQVSGFKSEEIIGKDLNVLFGKNLEISENKDKDWTDGKTNVILPDQVILKHKDGKQIPVLVSAGFLPNEIEQNLRYVFLFEPSDLSESSTNLGPETIRHLMAITSVLKLPAFVIDKNMQLAGYNSFFSDLARKAGISQYMLNRPLYETPKFSFFGDMQDLQEIFRSGDINRLIRKYVIDESIKFIEFTRVPLKKNDVTTHIISIMADITTERAAVYESEKIKKTFNEVFLTLEKVREISSRMKIPIQEIIRKTLEPETVSDKRVDDIIQEITELTNELDISWIEYLDLIDQLSNSHRKKGLW